MRQHQDNVWLMLVVLAVAAGVMLGLSLAWEGFLIHPAIATFSAGGVLSLALTAWVAGRET